MSYELAFLDEALKEWRRLDSTTREQFKAKLAERLAAPRVPAAKLSGHPDRYKIKLRSAGYRLVYEVRDQVLLVLGPVNTDFAGAKPAGQAPIKARVAAQTGRLGKTRNAEWRLASRLPFGLEPKRPIAALPILAGSPTQLRLAPGARPFGPPTHPAKSVLTGPGP